MAVAHGGLLLTDEAVRAATFAPEVDAVDGQKWAGATRSEMARAFYAAFLRHHATEGRTRLVYVVRDALDACGAELTRTECEAVVTALFGGPS